MKLRIIPILFSMFLLAGCTEQDNRPSKAEEQPVVTAGAEVIATELNIPWSINYDGQAFYISERAGSVVKIEDGRVERQDVFFEKKLSSAAEAGFLGLLLHPEKENTAYGYYTYENGSGRFNRVVELIKERDGWHEGKLYIDRIPSGNVHHGGRLKIGPDGKLYITTGDAANADLSQNLQSLNGKILRMNLDGSIPEDNPFPNSYVYSYGHRNPQGLAWDSSGNLYSTDHGASAHDEINAVKPGANYGWPIVEGAETQEGMEAPLFHSGNVTWAPSGLAYHDGMLFAAQLRGEGVLAFDLSSGTNEQIVTGYGRIRDVYIIDDDLYFITNNTDGRGNPGPDDDRLIRIPLNRKS